MQAQQEFDNLLQLGLNAFPDDPSRSSTVIMIAVVQRANLLIEQHSFAIANELIALAAKYTVERANEVMREIADQGEHAMRRMTRRIATAVGVEISDDEPASAGNALSEQELRDLGVEVEPADDSENADADDDEGSLCNFADEFLVSYFQLRLTCSSCDQPSSHIGVALCDEDPYIVVWNDCNDCAHKHNKDHRASTVRQLGRRAMYVREE